MPNFTTDANGVPLRTGGTPTGDAGVALETRATVLSSHIGATTGIHGATSAATANRIVLRNSSGGFAASAIQFGGTNLGSIGSFYGTAASPSLSAVSEIAGFGSSVTIQTVIGADPNSPYGGYIQVKRTTNDGSSWPLNLNPLGGNVGIGTLNPTKLLQVGSSFTVDSSANVGCASVSASTVTTNNLNDNGAGVIALGSSLQIYAYTVGTLPAAGSPGRIAFATDARKPGESAGSGTGRSVEDDGTNWITGDGLVVAA
jgi:hypothetical protein